MIESDGQLKFLLDNVKAVWYNQTDPSHYLRPDGIEMRRRKFKTKKDRATPPYPISISFQQVFVSLSV